VVPGRARLALLAAWVCPRWTWSPEVAAELPVRPPARLSPRWQAARCWMSCGRWPRDSPVPAL